jgi:cell division protein FtsL
MELTRESTAFDYGAYFERVEYDRTAAAAAPAKPVKKRGAAMRYTLLLIAAAAVAAVCIAWLCMKAQVYKSQREVNDVQAKIKAAQRLNSDLNQQLNQAKNVDSIMSRAQALGMGYPDNSQVLYVNLAGDRSNVEMKNNK